ncbi:MAG: hypothetical protein V3V00_14055 [Saprospiraceae bacterium]
MKNHSIAIITLFLCMLSTISYAQKVLSAQEWQEDLKFLQTSVHTDYPFLFKKVTAKAFDAEVEKLHQEIPSLEPHELPVALARIVSLFQYGHTQITFGTVAKGGVLPVNLYHFNDGVYIEGTQKAYKKVLGAKVLKIGDIPIEKALKMIRPVVPVENNSYFKAYGLRFLTVPAVLHAQKVISKLSGEVTLALEKGGIIFNYAFPTIALKELSRDYNLTIPNKNWLSVRDQTTTPLYLKHLNEQFYYFEYLAASKTMYVRQSSVFNHDSETLKDFYKRLFAFIDGNTVDKLVYDVRLNGGGNNYNNLGLIKGLMARPKINKKGHFFYIIGRNTFSACQNLTNEIGRYTEAIIVGEPTAENVNFYGDARRVTLPHSRINAYLSFAWWQDVPQWENRDATLPNIAIDLSFEEYKTNQDPVLEAALNYIDDGFILDPMKHLTQLFIAGNYAQLKTDATTISKSPKYKYYEFEKEFTDAAFRIIDGGNKEGGYFILELVAELNPTSASALYNLANLQVDLKQIEKAKVVFEKVIELDPNSSLARIATKRLKELNK